MRTTVHSALAALPCLSAMTLYSLADPVNLPLEIEKTKAEIEYRFLKSQNDSTREADVVGLLEVLTQNNDGFEARWTTELVAFDGVAIDRPHQWAADLLVRVPIRFESDEDGLPIRIEDKASVVEAILESDVHPDSDTAVSERVREFLAGLSDKAAAQVFLKPVSYMAICQGTALEPGELVESQSQIPSPWGSGSIVTDVTYELISIDREAGEAMVQYRSRYNPDSLRQVLAQAASKIAPDDENLARQFREARFAREDRADCVVDTDTGWVQKMTFVTSISAGARILQSETYEINVRWIE